ncbi:MAG: hypothetical protein MOGMAGMI_01799 [Candidatus Omnitrophica bacterium]|nr:hypothetical protein [Candidatus Omnitrophota bacterium]
MSGRAIILPTPSDPFLVLYWYKNFNTYRDYVDKLYLVLNTPSTEAPKMLFKLLKDDPKVKVMIYDRLLDHGNAINEALANTIEEYVGLIEDDAYVVNPKAIDDAFTWLESGKREIVGSKRGSCSDEILEKAKRVWGIDYRGYGDQGCNFWPCFFFTKTAHLKATDRNFNARRWEIGESLYSLGVAESIIHGDTFVNTSLQLQSLFDQSQIEYMPQGHANPLDIQHYEKREGIFNGKMDWLHIGSLSSGFCGLLRNQRGVDLARRKNPHAVEQHELPNKPTNEFEEWEYERRVQIWLTAYEENKDNIDADFGKDYLYALENVIMQFRLSKKRIRIRREIYKQFFNL